LEQAIADLGDYPRMAEAAIAAAKERYHPAAQSPNIAAAVFGC
jgi:hypothetical protein